MSKTLRINKKGIVKKSAGKTRTVNYAQKRPVDAFREMKQELERLKEDIAEYIILQEQAEDAIKSVYSMSAEEYMRLPGDVRL